MKKYVLGFFAILFAVALSSFTHLSQVQKTNDVTTYWFFVDSGDAAGTSTSPTIAPPGDCNTLGSGCIEGYQSSTPLSQKPSRQPDGTFAHD